MRHRFTELHTWEAAAQLAASLHERDGYSSRSAMPTPMLDACLAPTVVCVDSGWAQEMGGKWCCTAPYGHSAYIDGDTTYPFVPPCPARITNKRVGLAAQMPETLGRFPEPPDFETVAVLAWVRTCLACITASEMSEGVCDYAKALLSDLDVTTDMETVEALGREMVRRFACQSEAQAERDRRVHERIETRDDDPNDYHEKESDTYVG